LRTGITTATSGNVLISGVAMAGHDTANPWKAGCLDRWSGGLYVFDIITKREYWEWQDAGLVDIKRIDLKGVQDAYVLSRTSSLRGTRILEVGGGNSRVLAMLSEDERGNECWIADRFEGAGGGPTSNTNPERIRTAKCFVGEFSDELPAGYFDFVISVSVVEHVPTDQLDAFFADSARVLRPGGRIIHAIDLYVYDFDCDHQHRTQNRIRIRAYRSFGDRADLGLRFVEAPQVDEDIFFKCSFASNTDLAMNGWNKLVPSMRPIREIAQSVSIKSEWVKD
jgi:SAM-dependent methyltransferase